MKGISILFGRMDFQQMSKKADAERFERGYLKRNHRKSFQSDFAQMRKAAGHNKKRCP
jgi:hypothetical protein